MYWAYSEEGSLHSVLYGLSKAKTRDERLNHVSDSESASEIESIKIFFF